MTSTTVGRTLILLALTAATAYGQTPDTHPLIERDTIQAIMGDVVQTQVLTRPTTSRYGADIVSLNVDSIMRVLPAATLTDLLETRVPGLVVQHTSGAPGDPSYLYFRGASSAALSNAPVLILDGVRLSNTRNANGYLNLAQNSTGGAFAYATPSPLDQIDPNTVDRIDILRGPAAAAMYGSDAAHGVIVITTKHGTTGAPHWTLALNGGLSSVPGDYPESYFGWGHEAGFSTSAICSGPSAAPAYLDSSHHSGSVAD